MRRCSVKPYEGDEKYIFVSYCHRDRAMVFPIIEQLAKDGYRVWYDEGIDPGSEWPEIIAKHLNESAVCLAFISANSLNSHNCRREITFALLKRKYFISVVLEAVQMSLGMEMQLSAAQSIFKYMLSSDIEFFGKLYEAKELQKCLGEPNYSIVVSNVNDYLEEMRDSEKVREPFSDKWFVNDDVNIQEETARRVAEEEKRCQEEEARKAAEEERCRKAEEEARKAAEEEKRRQEEEAACKAAEEETRRQEEEAARQAEEEERRCREEEEARQAAEEERRRREEEEAARQAEEEERCRREEEAARQAEEEERRRREEEAARRAAEEEKHRQEEEKEGTQYLPREKERYKEPNLAPVCHHMLKREKTNEIIRLEKSQFVLGRSEIRADYVIRDNRSVSRIHAAISAKGEKCYIEDMKSLNKTYLNGMELQPGEHYELSSGDSIRISNEKFTYFKDE